MTQLKVDDDSGCDVTKLEENLNVIYLNVKKPFLTLDLPRS